MLQEGNNLNYLQLLYTTGIQQFNTKYTQKKRTHDTYILICTAQIYVRKSPEKMVLEKNLEMKSPNFLKSYDKMSLEIKSWVLDSWDFLF